MGNPLWQFDMTGRKVSSASRVKLGTVQTKVMSEKGQAALVCNYNGDCASADTGMRGY